MYGIIRERNFLALFIGQTISRLGDWVYNFTLMVYIFDVHGSAFDVGILLLCQTIPALVFGLFAGAIADKYSKKQIMIWSDVMRAILGVSMSFISDYYAVFVVVVFLNVFSAFFEPARISLMSKIVDGKQLINANNVMYLAATMTMLAGPMIGGVLLSTLGARLAFLFNGVSFIISAVSILFIKAGCSEDVSVAEPPRKLLVRDIVVGLKFVYTENTIRAIFASLAIVFVGFNFFSVLEIVFVEKELALSPIYYSVILSTGSAGLVIGSLLLNWVKKHFVLKQIFVAGILICAVSDVIFSVSSNMVILSAMSIISGVGNTLFLVVSHTLLQTITPNNMIGRVMSCRMIMVNIIAITSIPAAGYVSDCIGVRHSLIGGSLAIFLALLICGRWLFWCAGRSGDGKIC